jgi:hypothetical protein
LVSRSLPTTSFSFRVHEPDGEGLLPLAPTHSSPARSNHQRFRARGRCFVAFKPVSAQTIISCLLRLPAIVL